MELSNYRESFEACVLKKVINFYLYARREGRGSLAKWETFKRLTSTSSPAPEIWSSYNTHPSVNYLRITPLSPPTLDLDSRLFIFPPDISQNPVNATVERLPIGEWKKAKKGKQEADFIVFSEALFRPHLAAA